MTHTHLVNRQPVAYVAWEPTKSEMELLKQNPKRRRVEPNSTVGEPPPPPPHTIQISIIILLHETIVGMHTISVRIYAHIHSLYTHPLTQPRTLD